MNRFRSTLACSLALACAASALPVSAQVADNNCILAGRLSEDGRWAPRMAGVELLGQDGKAVGAADKAGLALVRQAKLSAPALLARCDGSGTLAQGPESPGAKSPVPAVGPGTVAVEAVNFPKMRRGGELVELRVTVPADRVTMVTR